MRRRGLELHAGSRAVAMHLPEGDNRRGVVDHHRGAGEIGFARGGRGIDFLVGSQHAEIILAVGEHIAVEGESAVMQVALEQHPAALVVGAEIEVIDQTVAIGILGLPTDGDLLGGGAGQRLGRGAGGG